MSTRHASCGWILRVDLFVFSLTTIEVGAGVTPSPARVVSVSERGFFFLGTRSPNCTRPQTKNEQSGVKGQYQ